MQIFPLKKYFFAWIIEVIASMIHLTYPGDNTLMAFYAGLC